MSKKVYIVLTGTESWLSKAIKLYTQQNFNHISIAFDAQLTEMYSFGRKRENNPFIGGFVQEDASSKLLRYAHCAVFELPVTAEQYVRLRQQMDFYKDNSENYRYNFLGLIAIMFKFKMNRSNAFFCSQFLATIFQNAGIDLEGHSLYFVKPMDFIHFSNMKLLFEGSMEQYLLSLAKTNLLLTHGAQKQLA